MTETVITTFFFLVLFSVSGYFVWLASRARKRAIKAEAHVAELQKQRIKESQEKIIEACDAFTAIELPTLELPTASQVSESAKKVDWEPDDYKDLSDGLPVDVKTKFKKHNYKRFEKDELDELGELTPHQLNKIGG